MVRGIVVFVGDDGSVVDDPEHGLGWRFGSDSAFDDDVRISQVRTHRTARDLRRDYGHIRLDIQTHVHAWRLHERHY